MVNLASVILSSALIVYNPQILAKEAKAMEPKKETTLYQNHPNPFGRNTTIIPLANPVDTFVTEIPYFIAGKNEHDSLTVHLSISDEHGNVVERLFEKQAPGGHVFLFAPSSDLKPGKYTCSLITTRTRQQKKEIIYLGR